LFEPPQRGGSDGCDRGATDGHNAGVTIGSLLTHFTRPRTSSSTDPPAIVVPAAAATRSGWAAHDDLRGATAYAALPMSDVFVSYASDDEPEVGALVERLASQGIPVWFAPSEIKGGELFGEAIVRAIEGCRVVLLMASRRAFASSHVFREVMIAQEAERAILPLFLETVEVPTRFRWLIAGLHHLVWARDEPGRSFDALRAALAGHGVQSPPRSSPGMTRPAARARAAALFEGAQRAHRERRLDEALRLAREARDLDVDDPRFWNDEGVILADLGRLDESLGCLGRALELAPTWVMPWNNRGRTLRILKRDADALACYERAIECAPGEWHPWFNKGNCLTDLGRLDEALRSLAPATPGARTTGAPRGGRLRSGWRRRAAAGARRRRPAGSRHQSPLTTRPS